MGKTIAERLRECEAGDSWTCWGSRLEEIMGGDECSCPEDTGDRITCHVCYESQLRKLADAIDEENEKFRTMGFLEGLKESDTQEAIEDDATVPAATYCVRHGLVESDTDVDDATLLELHILDLLRRQRKLLGGER